MILITEILQVPQILIEKYEGGIGVIELGILQSAIARPFQTFDGKTYMEQFWKRLRL